MLEIPYFMLDNARKSWVETHHGLAAMPLSRWCIFYRKFSTIGFPYQHSQRCRFWNIIKHIFWNPRLWTSVRHYLPHLFSSQITILSSILPIEIHLKKRETECAMVPPAWLMLHLPKRRLRKMRRTLKYKIYFLLLLWICSLYTC